MEKNCKPKVFIIGISSYLGYALANYLKPNYLIGGISFEHQIKISGAQCFQINIKNMDLLEPITKVQEPDFIINAIGISDRKMIAENTKLTESFNVMLPVSIAVLANKMKKKFIHLSCAEVYEGEVGPYKEDTTDYATTDVFGKQKFTAETYIRTQTPESTLLRIGKVIGPGNPFRINEFERMRIAISKNMPIASAKNKKLSYISTLSFCQAVDQILKNEIPNRHRTLNVGGPNLSEDDFLNGWFQLVGADLKLLKNPAHDYKYDFSLNTQLFQQNYPNWKLEDQPNLYANILREISPAIGIKKWQKTLQIQ